MSIEKSEVKTYESPEFKEVMEHMKHLEDELEMVKNQKERPKP